MPPPTFGAGGVVASDDANQWFVPLVALKGADQSVTSSTTLVNDSALVITPRINCTYWMEMYVDYEGGTNGASDLKGQFTVPSGAAINFSEMHNSASGATTVAMGQRASAATFVAGTNGAGNLLPLECKGTFSMAGTPGNLQFQWGQNGSSGTPTIVHAGSVLMLRRIA